MAVGPRMVPVGRHRLAATVLGTGTPTVVIEPSFGGCAADWSAIAAALAGLTTVVSYDRAPYGASSAARDGRTPREIAADLDGLLSELGVTGPLVLVESSHEGQRVALDGDRRSIIREWRAFRRATAGPPALPPGALGGRPLVVLTCSPGDPEVSLKLWRGRHDLHADLAGLSANSRHVVSSSTEHYLTEGDPELVVTAVRDVVRCVRSGGRLDVPAARADVVPAASEAE